MNIDKLKKTLDIAVENYNSPGFIVSDPISIPHQFSKKEDIEISAFLAASISWGQRPTIIKNASALMSLMENCPHDFIINSNESELIKFRQFVHRTFNGEDCIFFLLALKHIYKNCGGLENVFTQGFQKDNTIKSAIINFRNIFFETEHFFRTEKHISDPEKNSACKRINMLMHVNKVALLIKQYELIFFEFNTIMHNTCLFKPFKFFKATISFPRFFYQIFY